MYLKEAQASDLLTDLKTTVSNILKELKENTDKQRNKIGKMTHEKSKIPTKRNCKNGIKQKIGSWKVQQLKWKLLQGFNSRHGNFYHSPQFKKNPKTKNINLNNYLCTKIPSQGPVDFRWMITETWWSTEIRKGALRRVGKVELHYYPSLMLRQPSSEKETFPVGQEV